MRLVKAGPGEWEDLCRVYEVFFAYMAKQEPYTYQKTEANGAYYRKALESGQDLYTIAYDGDHPVGFCHVAEKETAPIEFYVKHRFAVLMELFVVSAYRGSEAGNLLMAEAKKWTRERKLDYLELRVTHLDTFARKLYEEEGFDITQHTMRCIMR